MGGTRETIYPHSSCYRGGGSSWWSSDTIKSMVDDLNDQAAILRGSGPTLMPQEEITHNANVSRIISRRASRSDLEGH